VSAPSATDGPTPAVERQLVADMARRGLPALPVLVLGAAALRGFDAGASALFGAGLALGNLALSAALVAGAARVSLLVLGAAAMGGFLLRLGVVMGAVLLVSDQGWVDLPVLGATLAATHLGLLVWEARHVSASLAFPALKPVRH